MKLCIVTHTGISFREDSGEYVVRDTFKQEYRGIKKHLPPQIQHIYSAETPCLLPLARKIAYDKKTILILDQRLSDIENSIYHNSSQSDTGGESSPFYEKKEEQLHATTIQHFVKHLHRLKREHVLVVTSPYIARHLVIYAMDLPVRYIHSIVIPERAVVNLELFNITNQNKVRF